ncbi:hypothetical protein M409DRAFT_17400 [Zasmidium cellare ATCC 36951]|uniref:Mediator of RNA polymerase II transcription subunit 8 n=1 Tax=Zasmidium cellare ATCC 36951 TaxID=1080233 RepID=A0A6A6D132_ZASCE|nr:uncharacterized protein M409DRAFT_17400 [Zasmidium cellare ATCC 36951]KAF2172160.1 hypothetical protein M409DRAFT_17400 [Zasmidium cellare ATCC 36951]
MALPQEHQRALDQLRTRLNQLLIALEYLYGNIQQQDPLPSWPALQSLASNAGQYMQELSDTLNSQRELFSTLHAYPTSTFPAYDPGRQELLYSLLYKKLDLRAEEWIDESLKDTTEQNGTGQSDGLASDQMEELWSWAGGSLRKFLEPWDEEGRFEDNFTVAEREAGVENVVTGIKRDLDPDPDEEANQVEIQKEKALKLEETEGPMPSGYDPSKPAMPLESLLRFATTGDMNPPGANR